MTGQARKIETNSSEERFQYAGLEVRFLLSSSDSNGIMSVFEFSVPANEYFREVRQLLSAGGPPNPAAMAETMKRHGMIPVPPPSTA
jgi:hypothetical protein